MQIPDLSILYPCARSSIALFSFVHAPFYISCEKKKTLRYFIKLESLYMWCLQNSDFAMTHGEALDCSPMSVWCPIYAPSH